MKIAASGSTSRLYRKLVMEQQLASSTGGWYSGSGLDSGKVSIYAVAADGVGLGKVEAAVDEVIARSARAVSSRPSWSAPRAAIWPTSSTRAAS